MNMHILSFTQLNYITDAPLFKTKNPDVNRDNI